VNNGELLTRISSFVAWLDEYGDLSQDPYDFWASPVGARAKRFAYRHPLVGLPLVAPFVILDSTAPRSRRYFRAKQRFAVADAHYAMGFFILARVDDQQEWAAVAEGYLASLGESRSPGFDNAGWGYPFDWEACVGTFKAGTPFITTTPYMYEAFECGYEATRNLNYLHTMRSIACFAYEDIIDQQVTPGVYACSYGPFDRRRVVNASSYRAFLLAVAGLRFGRDDWLTAAQGNLAFVLQSQQSDGSWFYAMDGKDRFVDNFHTCLVLKNLAKIWKATGDAAVHGAMLRGYDYYKGSLLDEQGLPIPFARTQRLNLVRRELYDFAEGINLALLMRELDRDADGILRRLLAVLLDDWVLADGHFVTRVTRFGRNTVPYHRWAQAQTFYALTRVCLEGV
jgi:hypothetical protein